MPSEAGHWYKRDGSPCYTIEGKNGQIRNTTLRDAKKLGLVPSVTTIIGCADKPGLTNWKIDQAILAALTCPRIDGEDEAAYLSRIKKDAAEQAKKAAERGTQIHGWIEGSIEGIEPPEEAWPFLLSVQKTLDAECGDVDFNCEKSFAFNRYGGKCDLHTDQYVVDFKTTEKDLATIKTWDEHALQLSAYDHGIPNGKFPSGRKCGILYINVHTAESRLMWIDPAELDKGWKMFNALLDYWYAKNGLEG